MTSPRARFTSRSRTTPAVRASGLARKPSSSTWIHKRLIPAQTCSKPPTRPIPGSWTTSISWRLRFGRWIGRWSGLMWRSWNRARIAASGVPVPIPQTLCRTSSSGPSVPSLMIALRSIRRRTLSIAKRCPRLFSRPHYSHFACGTR